VPSADEHSWFIYFSDSDGNTWAAQQMVARE
jgi:hypothetical protein